MTGHVLVIGGGAAGMTAALFLRRQQVAVTLLEQNDRLGKKLAITGKGRCNLTNACDPESFFSFVPQNPRFLYSAIYAFPPKETTALFESLGVSLKVERGNRVFPVSDQAMEVVNALEGALKREGVTLRRKAKVTGLLFQENKVTGVSLANGENLFADAVLIATGGATYPLTGSKGDGYTLAKRVGHQINPPRPSLVPMEMQGTLCRDMMGLSLKNVSLTLREEGKKKPAFFGQGELLFTHFGISGPLVLSASAYCKEGANYELWIDWKPALTLEQLDLRLQRELEASPKKSTAGILEKLLPSSAVGPFEKLLAFPKELVAAQWTKEQRQRLCNLLKKFSLPFVRLRPLEEGIITRGGILTKEVSPATMESKLAEGLFFAGEVLDVDALTGGFNLQIAFSTAHLAAKGIGSYLENRE